MASYYLWLKGLHVIFMVTWFAGLFYLPRLFIYHANAEDDLSRERFSVMQFRLFVIMTIGAVLTAVFGLWMWSYRSDLMSATWFQIKCVLLIGLIIYHVRCYQWIGRLKRPDFKANTKWLRWFNEFPTLFLISIALLAILKPA
ncbi:MAG: CopD family protein [Pseudomonadota bacterium]